ncbi:Tn3 family transposase [Rhizobium hidalgonense]|uniref:Tn3 family transposase n=1 Tax=Rhizobium hidalgonense TaxID=1538159 RepID=UPI003CC7CBBE
MGEEIDHVKVISAATHEASCVLAGLHHGTRLNISKHYTDTGGATGHVFALCAAVALPVLPKHARFPGSPSHSDRADRQLSAPGALSRKDRPRSHQP